jgi:hypothetical protein
MNPCTCGHPIEDHQETDTSAPEGCMECPCAYYEEDEDEEES